MDYEELRIKNFDIRLVDFDYLCDGKYFDFYPDREFEGKVDISLWEIESWGNVEFLNFFYECDRANIKVNVICQNNFLPMASLVGHSCVTVVSNPATGSLSFLGTHGETSYTFRWDMLKKVYDCEHLDPPDHIITFHKDVKDYIFGSSWPDVDPRFILGYGHLNDGGNIDIYNINTLTYSGMRAKEMDRPPDGNSFIKWVDGVMDSNKLDFLKREGIRCCLPSLDRVSELFKFYSSRPIYMSRQYFDRFSSFKDDLPKDKIAIELKIEEAPKTIAKLRELDASLGGDFFVERDSTPVSMRFELLNSYLSYQFLNCLFNDWKYLALGGASSITQGFYPMNNLMFVDLANISVSSSMLKKKLNKYFYGIDPLAIKISAALQCGEYADFLSRDNNWKLASDKIKGFLNGK